MTSYQPRHRAYLPRHRARRAPLLGRLAGPGALTLLTVAAASAVTGTAAPAAVGEPRSVDVAAPRSLSDARVAEERAAGQAASRSRQRELARLERAREQREESRAKARRERERAEARDRAARAKERAALQQSPQEVAAYLAERDYGWGAEEFSCLDALWISESDWRVDADNPTSSAYGIPQSLPGEKMAMFGSDWATNPVTQIRWGLWYIQQSYGTPCVAWEFKQANNWY